MAYDKVVDSVALDTQLTSIADAIRAKTSVTGSLAFPDGFSQAIAAIEAGGGAKVSTGTLVPAEKYITIEHGLGEVPNVFFWWVTDFVNHITNDADDGSVRVVSNGNSNTLCGGHIAGQSFVVLTQGSRSPVYYYQVYPNNMGTYSKKVYKLRSDYIVSDTGHLAYDNVGETVHWVAMVV